MKAKSIALFLLIGIFVIIYFSNKNTSSDVISSQTNIDTTIFDTNQLKYYIFDHSKIPDDDTTK